MSSNATFVKVIGDRNQYQDLPVTLEPSWNRAWEAFVFEPDWLQEVAGTFGSFPDTPSGRASCKAKAMTVTVREYARVKSGFADAGRWRLRTD